MKNPLTRRHERRILGALQALGPLDVYELADFLGTPANCLKKPLLNLTREGQVTPTNRPSLITGANFTWSIRGQEDNDDG